MKKLRGIWAVLWSRQYVVVTFDERRPPHILGDVVLGCHYGDAPKRLASACQIAHAWERIADEEGQQNSLRRAREVLGMNPRQHDT